jgi:hypothetical protein
MDRGVVIGGALICASFLLAVALNHSDVEPKVPAKRYEPAPKAAVIDTPTDTSITCADAALDSSPASTEHQVIDCE